jgi:L-threonylcarbamoyladenylate synthase
VHVPDIHAVRKYIREIDPVSESLAARFWPGPLTIVFPVEPSVFAPEVTAGLDTVGIRVPDHPVALALLHACNLPLAAPSANKSGSPSPTTAQHVRDDYSATSSSSSPAMVLDGGSCRVGLESTVVRVMDGRIHILRPGGVSVEQILSVPGVTRETIVQHGEIVGSKAPRAPGMKYRHYAPVAPVVVVSDWKDVSIKRGDVLILFDDSDVVTGEGVSKYSFGTDRTDLGTASARLFDLLRMADKANAQRVLVDCAFNRECGLGVALWNRISKAASKM